MYHNIQAITLASLHDIGIAHYIEIESIHYLVPWVELQLKSHVMELNHHIHESSRKSRKSDLNHDSSESRHKSTILD